MRMSYGTSIDDCGFVVLHLMQPRHRGLLLCRDMAANGGSVEMYGYVFCVREELQKNSVY